jgi:hypothetical protein
MNREDAVSKKLINMHGIVFRKLEYILKKRRAL